jgi:hypothetical protein
VGLHLVGDEYFRHAFQMDQGIGWVHALSVLLANFVSRDTNSIRTHTRFG